jgi:hypothetical protein
VRHRPLPCTRSYRAQTTTTHERSRRAASSKKSADRGEQTNRAGRRLKCAQSTSWRASEISIAPSAATRRMACSRASRCTPLGGGLAYPSAVPHGNPQLQLLELKDPRRRRKRCPEHQETVAAAAHRRRRMDGRVRVAGTGPWQLGFHRFAFVQRGETDGPNCERR